jgi:putative DNA primase/helicase
MKDRYLDEFKDNPNLNIGFKVMGYSVLDIDNKNKNAGDISLAQLLRDYEINFDHVISVNCSNGQHIYANNTHLKNTAGVIGKGLDVRSEGGFIVAPGSVHKSGKVYQWNEIGEVATIPDEWIYTETDENEISSDKKSLNRSNQTAEKKLKDIILPKNLTSDYVIKKGDRELTLFKWACRERGNGANAEQLFDTLVTIRDTYCEEGDEPVTDEEVREIAESASRFPTNAEKKLSSFDPQN